MNARTCTTLLAAFAGGAALGVMFALLGPVPFVRLLGLAAFLTGAAGCAVQVYAMREFAPATYVALRRRARVYLRRAKAILDPAPAPAAWR